jgi:hypothetical protein
MVFFVLVFGAFVLGVFRGFEWVFPPDFFEGYMDGCLVHLCG